MEGMGEMMCLVPMDLKHKSAQMSLELSCCMQEGLEEACLATLHVGGANHLYMPNDPDYLAYQPGVQGWSYQTEEPWVRPLHAVHDHNIPCAVCYASTRVAVTMILAKTRCPSTWTLEYSGCLMSAAQGSHYHTMFECVDKFQDFVPGSASNINGAQCHICRSLPLNSLQKLHG